MKKAVQILFILVGVIASIFLADFVIRRLYKHRKSSYVDISWDSSPKPWEE